MFLAASILLELTTAMFCAASVVTAWRGAWLALDFGFMRNQPIDSAAVGLGIGGALLIVLALAQPLLGRCAAARPARVWWAVDALFSYCGLWCCVLVWRGVWQLLDHAFGIGFLPAPADHALALEALWSHFVGVGALLLVGEMR